MKNIKHGDIIIIVLVLLLAFCMLLPGNAIGESAVVEVDGRVVKSLDLNHDGEFVYDGKYKNVITVENGEVFVSFSDCPDNTCVHSGRINKNGRTICCLPNRLTVRVTSKSYDVDVVSG